MRIARRVEQVERRGDGLSIRTDGVEIRLLFLTDDILRIRAGFDPGFDEASYALVTTAWPDRLDDVLGAERQRVTPAGFDLSEEPRRFVAQGARLRVEIDRAPFRIQVFDADGTRIHADLIDLGYQEDSNRRRIHTSEIDADDCFYGFGEKTGPWNKAGRLLTLSPKDAMGYDPAQTDPLYKHIPFYLKLGRRSRAAVGYFYHNTYECDLDLGRERSNYWPPHSRYRTDGGDIDLFLIAGPRIRDVVRRYTDLTGRSAMLPKSALGYLGSSMYYPELPEGADEAILGFVDTTRAKGIPVDGFQLSSGYTQQTTAEGLKRCVLTWNDDRFSDPASFFAAMGERGITVSPNVKPGVLLVHPNVEGMREEGLFVRDSERDEAAVGTWWGGLGHFVDFTDEGARAAWKRRLTDAVLSHGTSSVWNDNCEYDSIVDKDARVSFDGGGGTIGQLKSVMPNLMCHVTRDAIAEHTPTERPYIVCRSGYSGIQRYAQTWSGDNRTSWEALRLGIATVLGMSLSGVANQGSDTCGFYGVAPDAELLTRWVQHGIFQPRFSIHSVNTDNTVTEPWMYRSATDDVRDAIRLRYRLFPYLYSLMERAHRLGLPIMEPLCSAFQDDPGCDEEGVDFMLGEALLVANVVEPGARTRRIRFPGTGDFYHLFTRERYAGGSTVDLPVDLSSIPVFVPAGGILPMALDQLDNLSQDTVTALHLVCAPDRDGRCGLYEDDGLSTAYQDGDVLRTEITMRAGARVEISARHDGPFESTIERVHLDVINREMAPFWVTVDGETLTHHLDRDAFERAETGWYYSQTLRSVQIVFPHPGDDWSTTISFEQFDMIGIDADRDEG